MARTPQSSRGGGLFGEPAPEAKPAAYRANVDGGSRGVLLRAGTTRNLVINNYIGLDRLGRRGVQEGEHCECGERQRGFRYTVRHD